MKICRICIDAANNNSSIGTTMYLVETGENGQEVSRQRIPGTTRLWADASAQGINSCLVPSVILYKSKQPAGTLEQDCYSWDAVEVLKNPNMQLKACSDIKYNFFIEKKKFGENADHFRDLIRHLMECIQFDQLEDPDAYELSISYPVVCSNSDMGFLEDVIGEVWLDMQQPRQLAAAAFVDEAECAFRFAMADQAVTDKIIALVLEKKEPLMLVTDIGGSTMELCLYRFTRQGDEIQHERLKMLYADSDEGRGMGSCRVDKMLLTKLNGMGVLDSQKLHQIDKNLLMLRFFTPLKEELNERLKAGKPALLNALHPICNYQKLQQHNNVTKADFESWCGGYTATVAEQISLLCKSEGLEASQIDMVIMTGGGCELYPVESAIRQLIRPGDPAGAAVFRPNDPHGVLDQLIAEDDHPDYIDGLCPRSEVASLACVLGNLAQPVPLRIPPPPPADNQAALRSVDLALAVSKLMDLEKKKDAARKWVYGYTAANFGLGAAIPPGFDIPFLTAAEGAMAVHIATIMYKGTNINAKDAMTSIVSAIAIPLLGYVAGPMVFNEIIKGIGTGLAGPTGGVSYGVTAVIGGTVAAAITLALGYTYVNIVEGLITGKLTADKLINKDPATMKELKRITKENYKQAKKAVKKDKRFGKE